MESRGREGTQWRSSPNLRRIRAGEWGYVPGVAIADVADFHVLSTVRADEHVAGGAVHMEPAMEGGGNGRRETPQAGRPLL
jgi:hypothetical protein